MEEKFKKEIVLAIIDILNDECTVSVPNLVKRTSYTAIDIVDCLPYIIRATDTLTRIHETGKML